LVLGLFLVVAGQFMWVTPILEGPDSYQHYRFARYLVLHHRFPSLDDPDPANAPYQEAAQYPLYYMLGAAVSFPVATDDFPQVVHENPHAGDLRGNGNANFLFHRPFAGFPHGTELAARLVEVLSLCCGLLTVGCAWFLGRLASPKSAWLAAGAGAVLAADPPFAAFSAFVTNDDLVAALSSLTLVLLVVWVIRRSARWGWLSALALALAVLSKFNAVGLVVPYAAAILMTSQDWKSRFRAIGKLALVVAAVDGWWMVRNQIVNGDFSGMLAVNGHAYGQGYHPFDRPVESVLSMLHQLPSVLHGLFSTGAYAVDSPAWLYAIPTVLGLVGLAAGIVAAVARARKEPWLWLVLLWPFVNVSELVVYGGNIAATGARLLFPSIACLALLVALGWEALLERLRAPMPAWPVLTAGVAVSLLVPRLVVAPAFAYPPAVRSLPASASTAGQASFAGAVELAGAESNAPTFAEPGVWYQLTLYWRLQQPTDRWLDTFIHIDSPDPAYSSVASYDGAVGGGTYPPNFWQPGQIVVDRYNLMLKPDTRPDRRNALPLSIRVGMYDEANGKVTSEPPEGADRGVEVARWKLRGESAGESPAAREASFVGGLDLVSAQAKAVGPSSLQVDLRWSAASQPTKDYTVFVQVLSPAGRVLAQHDSYPLGGRYPTMAWSPREQVFDSVTVPLQAPLEIGDRVIAGIYVLPDSRPVPTTTGEAFVRVPLS
jgi:hypothetical protein